MNLLNILKKLDFKTLLILALVIVILLMRACQPAPAPGKNDHVKIGSKSYTIVKTVIDTVTVDKTTVVYRPGKDIYHEKIVTVRIPMGTDTSAALADYFTKKLYVDTLTLNDSLGYVTVSDTLFKNSISGRKFKANVRERVINNTIYITPDPVAQFYFGGTMGFDKQNIVNFAGPSLLLKTKKDQIYSLGVGYSGDKQIGVMGSIYWKIKLKK